MFYYCLSHSSGGAFVAQLGLDEVLFVQKVYIMSTYYEQRVYKRGLKQAENVQGYCLQKPNFSFLWKFHES